MDHFQNLQTDKMVKAASDMLRQNPGVAAIGAFAVAGSGLFMFRRQGMKRDGSDYNSNGGVSKLLNNDDHTLTKEQFGTSIADYEGMFKGARNETGAITSVESVEDRKQRYATMVDHFYNLVTDFYEWGWGQSFHFAPRWANETFNESIVRAEYHLASRLGLKPGMKCMDIGCGVGGPMRNIAAFSGASIEGMTINQYQVNIGNKYNEQRGLAHITHLNQGDFQKPLPWPEASFEAAYQIEATCHSPDRVVVFGNIGKCLKKDGLFCGYEWVMTDKYDPNNKDHMRIKEGIEVGNGLPTLVHYSEIVKNMEQAGFEVVDYYDANRGVHASNEVPWYETLAGKMSLSGFRMTHIGRCMTHSMVWTLETIRIAPEGSTRISALLNATALDLVEGGRNEIFTPSFFFLGRKK
jgi:sterol 24-C-methyltransferase